MYIFEAACAVCMGVVSWFKGAGRIPMTTVGLADKSTSCAAHRYHREMRFQITSKVTILINDPRTHSLLKLPLSVGSWFGALETSSVIQLFLIKFLNNQPF